MTSTAPEHGLRLVRALRRDPLRTLTRLHRDHGPIVRLRVPRVPVYLVSDPDAIQHVLTRTHRGYDKGAQPLSRVLGQGLLTADADTHRGQRRLIQPMFHGSRIAGYADTFVALADTVARRWSADNHGRPVDVHRELTELTLEIIARTVFDVDLDDDVIRAIRAAAAVTPPGPLAVRWSWRLPLPANRRLRRALSTMDEVVAGLIAGRRASGADGTDVLSLLLNARDARTGAPMSERLVRDEVLTLLLAGHETTANALAWALYLVAGRPEVQDRVHGELDAVAAGRTPMLSDVAALRYTGAVWRETLRLYPPAWLVVRRLAAPGTVGGRDLPAGAVLLLSPWVVHRDPRWWPEPEQFDPERWLDPHVRPRFAYFPFGGGPRQCIGNDYADLEGVLVLATLLRRCRFAPTPAAPPAVPMPRVTLRPANGMTLAVVRCGT